MAEKRKNMRAAPSEMPKLGGQSGTIGGSSVGSILGLNTWTTPWDVWARHVLGVYDVCDPDDETDPRNRGTRLEPIVRALASKELGLTILEPQGRSRTIYHPQDKRFTGSIDGIVYGAEGEVVGLAEFKTANLNTWKGGEVPEYQWWQLQHYLWITGVREGWFFCLRADEKTFQKIRTIEDAQTAIHFNGARLWTQKVYADPAYEREIVPKLIHFFDNYLATGTPPPVDHTKGCRDTLRLIYPQTEEVIETTPELEKLARDYLFCRQSEREFGNQKAEAGNRLKGLLAGKRCAVNSESFSRWAAAETDEDKAKAVKNSTIKIGLDKRGSVNLKGVK